MTISKENNQMEIKPIQIKPIKPIAVQPVKAVMPTPAVAPTKVIADEPVADASVDDVLEELFGDVSEVQEIAKNAVDNAMEILLEKATNDESETKDGKFKRKSKAKTETV